MAGRIKDEDVTHIRDHSPIDDVVGDYVQLKNAGGGQKKGLCPFHDEKSPSFHVTPSKGYFHCFGCQVGGDVIAFIMKLEWGRFVCDPPKWNPHKYNGQYGPGFISVMTPGDPLPPPSRHIEPPFSVGEVREVVEKPSTLGRIFRCVSRPAPGWGASRRRATATW